MEENLRKTLEQGISAIDPTLLTDSLVKALVHLYDEITLFNPQYGLVNAQGYDLVVRHILDCLAPAPLMKANLADGKLRMADLGSGSGLPGLVLASAFPQWDITLVERMGRRAGFLRNTVAMMGMNARVHIVQKDLSGVQDSFDVVTFRAFRQFKDIISDLDRILVPGGRIFAYKSSEENIREEIDVANAYRPCVFKCSTIDYEVPMLDAKRRMLVVEKP